MHSCLYLFYLICSCCLSLDTCTFSVCIKTFKSKLEGDRKEVQKGGDICILANSCESCTIKKLLLLLLLLCCFSRVRLCVTPETTAYQSPLSLGFSRQEHWSGLPFPSPMRESEKWKWSRPVMSDSSRPHQAPPSMGFSRQEYWSGVPLPCPIKKLSAEELMLLNCGVGEDSWESLGLQGDPASQS